MVVIRLSAIALTGKAQDRTGRPSTCTVQAPHWAMPQPYLVPMRPSTSRSTQSSGVSESTSMSWVVPLTVRRTIPLLPSHPLTATQSVQKLVQKMIRVRACVHSSRPWAPAGPLSCLMEGGRRPLPAAATMASRHLDVVVLQRERADTLSGRLEERIEHRGRGDADGRLAHPAPGVAAPGRHQDRFDLGHLRDAHRVVGVEIGLLDAAVLDGALLIEQRGQAVDERARDLPIDLRRVDGVGRIG